MINNSLIRQPTLYIPHGAGPCFFMDWNPANTWTNMGNFLQGITNTLKHRPQAIIMVSAHWVDTQFSITSHAQPELIYDYYGFPAHTYELAYPAVGNSLLAERVAKLITASGIEARLDSTRGYDHGMFVPLKLMFPQADIPVIQLSLRTDLDPQTHFNVGKALQPLRAENVLIIGSGMSFHNMRAYGDKNFTHASDEFDEWLTKAIENPQSREQMLTTWAKAPYAYDCHPQGREEHLIPLLVAAGACGFELGQKIYSERVLETTISAFMFGET